MTLPKKCPRGNKCLVHGFPEPAASLLVRRAFDLIVLNTFTVEDVRKLRQVEHGKR